METLYNDTPIDPRRQAQALLFLSAFDYLCAKATGKFRLVPLKGIDLICFLYSDTLDRELKDIDMLVAPAEKAMDFIEMLQDDGYQPEFSFALDKAALRKKRKVSMLSQSERKPNVDIHLALITKKFFSYTINGFNQDALSRTKAVDEVVSVLDDVDRWMYLAAHLTFHFLEGDKWYRDLVLLMDRFSEDDISTLIKRAKHYNFERVVGAICCRIHSPKIVGRIDISQLLTNNRGKRFLRYINYIEAHPEKLRHGLRLSRYYWEFVFISKTIQRCHSLLCMVFPSIGNMQNIYRCNVFYAILLYVPHIFINIGGLLLFSIQYYYISNFHNK